ncbi:hypothetical protein ABBQ38_008975 [Trebouxia sp. C0009 RCD-2024]
MPVTQIPYKRPFFQISLTPAEIEEDVNNIMTNTKRRRRPSPPTDKAPERQNNHQHNNQ